MKAEFPFSAVVGQEQLKLALLLSAVDPSIGGVLIKGERGTAKTTVARGLAALLPPRGNGSAAPFIELPLGATEDRVVGSLDVGKALREGDTQLRSGVLARANGGVLYVDEVNLLPDHLVDLLLDAAASGWVTVERDGVSAGEAARFVLVGTMNPEEGDLRPQFLDRFGLVVEVRGLDTQQLRMQAVAGRLEFDADAAGVIGKARAEEDALRQAIIEARARLVSLTVSQEHLAIVTTICADQMLDGIRGDLAIIKTARALAAWENADAITPDHLQRAAAFALPHRIPRRMTSNSARRRAAVGDFGPAPPEQASAAVEAGSTNSATAQLNSIGLPVTAPKSSQPSAVVSMPRLVTDSVAPESSGRRGMDGAASRRGPRATPYDQTGTLAVNETLATAVVRGGRVEAQGLAIAPADLMQHERKGPGRSHVLFLVDASASMATQRRLDVAKAVAMGLLRSNYQNRDLVALMTFRGEGTDWIMPFTNRIDDVELALQDIPTGGRTPLARGLLDAADALRSRAPSLLILFTDGRANVSERNGDPWAEALAACAEAKSASAGAVVIDCEPGPILLGRAKKLASALQAECVSLSALQADDLTLRIQRRLEVLE